MIYRRELPADADGIHRVVTAAFGQPDEALLVERLRDAGRAVLSAVAVTEPDDAGAPADTVAAHILFSPLDVEENSALSAALALAPLAVLPQFQNQGVGTALTRWALDECRRDGHRAVFVLGHPAYYPRFGFRLDLAQGFACPYAGPHFMGLELVPGALATRTGRIVYAPEFG